MTSTLGSARRRALVVLGAGASIDFGAPSTGDLTDILEERLLADERMHWSGGDEAWREIKARLAGYLDGGETVVNFEHIYHCAHELQFLLDPTPGAVIHYRPLLRPFISRDFKSDERALRALCNAMATTLFDQLAQASASPARSLRPFARFLSSLREDHVMRIYSTNYDDFPLQAAPDLHIGFETRDASDVVRFDGRLIEATRDMDCLYHLHGSVHLGFPHAPLADVGIGELCWFADRALARKYASYDGSGARRMDGGQVQLAAVVTGLDKLSRLQQQPFASFYAAMAQDAVRADVIYVIGSGLGDLHLNTWLTLARARTPPPPIIMVDQWDEPFLEASAFETGGKLPTMWHGLRMNIGYEPWNGVRLGEGWTLSKDRSCALGQGFQRIPRRSGRPPRRARPTLDGE